MVMKKVSILAAIACFVAVTFSASWSLMAASAGAAKAAEQVEKKPIHILFTNVNVFDGFSDKLQTNMRVLVENNYI